MFKKVFIDSDVVISSLISSSGAANLLLSSITNLKLYISNVSQKELIEVADRLGLDQTELKNLLKRSFKKVYLKQQLKEIKVKYSEYIVDQDDAHIIAGAKKAKVNYLISYNTKHFKIDKIKEDFNIMVMAPANFLQYLRSIDLNKRLS
ncbi:MAG: PIN domain-containing protein [Candidatus Daviesbacteria bacterium]|nr:PIN domain-containing protein [Candidatus Daviesbacteria bacterium]